MPQIPSDVIARKYCFRASVKIMNQARVPVGVFFAYASKPTITRDVERIGQQFCLEQGETRGYVCDDSELILHEECPVELTSDIYFQPFESFTGRSVL